MYLALNLLLSITEDINKFLKFIYLRYHFI